jgi:hypothetical protein
MVALPGEHSRGCGLMVRTIEIRRDSFTEKGKSRGRGSHLSTPGMALARELGAEMGRPYLNSSALAR